MSEPGTELNAAMVGFLNALLHQRTFTEIVTAHPALLSDRDAETFRVAAYHLNQAGDALAGIWEKSISGLSRLAKDIQKGNDNV